MTIPTDAYLVLFELIGFLIPCIVINASLNIFGVLKKRYGYDKYDRAFDFDFVLYGHRVLGKSTTWGGFFVSLVVGYILQYIFLIPGLLMGIGCFFGHALGSFIKRRAGLLDGAYMPVIDHGDYIICTGALLYVCNYIMLDSYVFGVALILIVHPILCRIGFVLRLREKPF